MANAIPVLPDVGSRMVHPGVSRPSRSADSIIASAGRSFTDPVGLRSSSLAQSLTPLPGDSRGSPTSGVSPSASSNESYLAMNSAAGDSGQDRDRVAVGHLRLEATGEPDVLVVDVHVDEPVQGAFLDQAGLQATVASLEVVDDLGDGRAAGLNGLLATSVGAQD